MKAQIEIDRLETIPQNHYVLTPVICQGVCEWHELDADSQWKFYFAVCGNETLLYCTLPDRTGFIDTKSKVVERVTCPQCKREMNPCMDRDGFIEPDKYVCGCGMEVNLEYEQ